MAETHVRMRGTGIQTAESFSASRPKVKISGLWQVSWGSSYHGLRHHILISWWPCCPGATHTTECTEEGTTAASGGAGGGRCVPSQAPRLTWVGGEPDNVCVSVGQVPQSTGRGIHGSLGAWLMSIKYRGQRQRQNKSLVGQCGLETSIKTKVEEAG